MMNLNQSETVMSMPMDIIYTSFFIMGNKFTVEDYDDTQYGVYHEEMFVGTCKQPTESSAFPVAVKYLLQTPDYFMPTSII